MISFNVLTTETDVLIQAFNLGEHIASLNHKIETPLSPDIQLAVEGLIEDGITRWIAYAMGTLIFMYETQKENL